MDNETTVLIGNCLIDRFWSDQVQARSLRKLHAAAAAAAVGAFLRSVDPTKIRPPPRPPPRTFVRGPL